MELNCNICDSRFLNKSALNFHQKKHKENRFACNDCQKQFTLKQSLIIHINAPRDQYFDLLPQSLQDKVGSSFLIDLESHDRAKLLQSLQGAGFDTDLTITLPTPAVVDKEVTPDPQPPSSAPLSVAPSSQPPLLNPKPAIQPSSETLPQSLSRPSTPETQVSKSASWFGRLKGSLRQLRRKNYKV